MALVANARTSRGFDIQVSEGVERGRGGALPELLFSLGLRAATLDLKDLNCYGCQIGLGSRAPTFAISTHVSRGLHRPLFWAAGVVCGR